MTFSKGLQTRLVRRRTLQKGRSPDAQHVLPLQTCEQLKEVFSKLKSCAQKCLYLLSIGCHPQAATWNQRDLHPFDDLLWPSYVMNRIKSISKRRQQMDRLLRPYVRAHDRIIGLIQDFAYNFDLYDQVLAGRQQCDQLHQFLVPMQLRKLFEIFKKILLFHLENC